VIRLWNSYGNQVPVGYAWDWSELLMMFKGPVSLAYLCFNVGWGCLLFAIALRFTEALRHRPGSWLVTLGQASLFTFLAHMLVYRTVGRVEVKFLPHLELLRYSTTFLIGLAFLVPMARWYANVKHRYPRSVLQYL
jgi:peptidoglycan/LPS O-acetylase OafA/YrhL